MLVSNRLRESFWVLSLGVIACFAFFFVLGAIDPGDVLGLTLIVLALSALWGLHMWLEHRHHDELAHDQRLTHARERRGF